MNNETPKVRPIFRCVSGVLFAGALFGITMAFWTVLNEPNKFSSYGFLLGQIWLAALCGYATLKGKVPNWLVNQK